MKRFFVCLAVLAAMFLMVGCQNKSQANNESQTSNESQVKKEAKIELEWSSVSDRKMKWNQAVRYCKNLVEDGHDDWRLPSVDEFRTTISPEYFPWNAVGGICSLSDQNDCLSASCWNDNASCCNSTASLAASLLYLQTRCPASSCSDEYLNTHPEIKKKMEKLISMAKSAKALWTSSVVSDENTYSWTFALMAGFMLDMAQDMEGLVQMDSSKNYVQCVRGKLPENIIIAKSDGLGADFIKEMAKDMAKNEKDPTAAASQSETKAKKEPAGLTKIGDLTWSSIAEKKMNWDDAIKYCEDLNEGGYSDWHLPNIDQLRILIQNHPGTQSGGSCPISERSGKLSSKDRTNDCNIGIGSNFSKLGDTSWFRSSSTLSDYADRTWIVAFDEGKVLDVNKRYVNSVRCVRGSQNEANSQNTTTTSSQSETSAKKEPAEPIKIGNLMWSNTADKEMDWNDGLAYCTNLNEGGYSDWRLPNIDELRTLIKNCTATETGGECKVTDSCLSWDECKNKACNGCDWDSSSKYCKLGGNNSGLLSSSVRSDNTEEFWSVVFENGGIATNYKAAPNNYVRCVR